MGPPPGAIRICRIMQQSGTKGNFFTYHYHQCHDSKATLRDRCEGAVDSSINGKGFWVILAFAANKKLTRII